MQEKELQAMVVELCQRLGLLVYHTHDSRRSQPGFPDLVVVGPGGLEFWELKGDNGRTTPEQREWIEAIGRTGSYAGVFRPDDWDVMERRARRLAA